MNDSAKRHPPSVAAGVGHVCLRDIALPLRAMLADSDWLPACQDVPGLQALLHRIDDHPDAGDEAAPPAVTLLLAAHQDFSYFRRALSARLNTPDDRPLHISPEEWLDLRLRHPDKAANLAPYARYRPDEDRFHIVD